jgi:hypothetical protein
MRATAGGDAQALEAAPGEGAQAQEGLTGGHRVPFLERVAASR